MSSSAADAGAAAERIAVVDTLIGPIAVSADGEIVTRVRFGADDVVPSAPDDHRAAAVARQFAEYFAGARETFDAAVDWDRLADGHAHVLRTLVRIAPYGCSVSYGGLAAAADVADPVAARVVGQVLNHNPFPLLVPCHRVVMSDGTLGGFGGGVWRKEALLRLEGVLPPTLFG